MRSTKRAPWREIFYGWYVVYAVGFVMTTTAGLAFYNLPVLLNAFVSERGFPVSLVSNATAGFFIGAGVAGVAAGQLVDRIDPRYVIMGSATALSLALLSIGMLHEPWHLFVFYAVFGLAYGGCGLVPTTTIVARWFERRRPLAFSIASTGLSLGGVVFTPISAFLILHLGLAGAAPWLALAMFLGVVPATLWIVRASPQTMGLAPDGAAHHESPSTTPSAPANTLSNVLKSRFFIAVAVTFLFALGMQVGGIAHVYRLANTRIDAETAAAAVAVLAISSLIGRLVVGWMLLKIGSRTMTFALITLQTGALALLAYADGAIFVLITTAMFGLTSGSILMMQPLLLAEAFGVKDYGRIYSIGQFVGVFGYAIGPAIMGFLYETSGGYEIPYLAAAAGSLIGMGALMFSGPTRQPYGRN